MVSIARQRPVVLCVLDGWGYREAHDDNAITLAHTPVFSALWRRHPHALLDASAGAVGLPGGQMGNSEVGHTTIGAGRVVLQNMPRIDAAIADGSLAANPVLNDLEARLRASGGACHLLGLLSPGGVHSHQSHIVALARVVGAHGVPVLLHAILDGRDTPPRSATEHAAAVLAALPGIRVGSVAGRYYAMDRDNRWERVARAYAASVLGEGEPAGDLQSAIVAAYAAGEGDEFVAPRPLVGYSGMADGDGLLMANFRADRAREILAAILDPGFAGFARPRRPRLAAAAGMVSYSEELDRHIAPLFPPLRLRRTLGELVAEAGLRQLRIAETEKYAHVTFFFNGGEEAAFPSEDRIMIPSSQVATYDLKPEMSAADVTDQLVAAVASGAYDFILVNYANTDMVGHTGDLQATIRAVETVDHCLGRLVEAVLAQHGVLLITADHGNAERMRDPTSGQPMTAHTTERVPVILIGAEAEDRPLRAGQLADVAPTLLPFLRIAQPAEMTGRALAVRLGEAAPRSARSPATAP